MATPYSRTRFRSTPVSSSIQKLEHGGVPSNLYPDKTTDQSLQTLPGIDDEYMSDVVTPDWFLKRKRGEIVNNPVSIRRRKIVYSSGNLDHTVTHPNPVTAGYVNTDYFGNYTARLDYFPSLGIPSIYSDTVAPVVLDEDRFIKLAAIKARNGISPISVQSLVSAVELPKTLELIRSSLSTIRQIRKSVVTGNPEYAKRAIGNQRKGSAPSASEYVRQTAHNRWLELRYGWTPLVFEVQGAIKALNRTQENPPRATSRGFEHAEGTNSVLHQWNGGSASGLQDFRFVREKTLDVRAYALYTADLKFQRARDFGVSELPLALWELVPYSFVVDWFVNIGNWIEALTPKLGIKILAEGYTIKTSDVLKRTFESWTKVIISNQSNDVSGSCIGATDVSTTTTFTRVPHFDVLLSLPPLNIRLDKKRVLDAIALISKTVK